ncbi:DUF418 domain-containing protein [Roseateles amylovorans]|uniref:DUF418 domain-containing protein n=1 Tax=Roseateles amylovorans TaxID=2978473 RepID=A0ABY6B0Z0_9BURK|nr:DUF418 domain-containing protein [Roseateles amylovorans]UXH79064.1 DUF418 domain-containing protein [Roseateles amylovorans]
MTPLPMPPSTALAQPTPTNDRLHTIDMLRGFALLGILAANIDTFAGPESFHNIPIGLAQPAFVGWHAPLDLLIFSFKWFFIEGKMRALFAMLFGAGVVLFTQRLAGANRGMEEADAFHRRNMWLIVFGFLHGVLIWSGDILLMYGATALLCLYPLRHLPARRLMVVGLIVWAVGGTWGLSNAFRAGDTLRDGRALHEAVAAKAQGLPLTPAQTSLLAKKDKQDMERQAKATAAVEKVHAEAYLDGFRSRASAFLNFVSWIFTSGWIAEVLGAMLVGMGLYKSGFLSGQWRTRTYAAICMTGYGLAAPVVAFGIWAAHQEGFSAYANMRWLYLPYIGVQILVMFANAAALLLLSRWAPFAPIAARLRDVGRMALTNYILTSLLCKIVFVWSPLALYGRLEYYQYHYVVVSIWLVNLTFSGLWMRHFRFGPLEWIWRSLTYWKRHAIRSRYAAA